VHAVDKKNLSSMLKYGVYKYCSTLILSTSEKEWTEGEKRTEELQ
jgi:hypothetical protein